MPEQRTDSDRVRLHERVAGILHYQHLDGHTPEGLHSLLIDTRFVSLHESVHPNAV